MKPRFLLMAKSVWLPPRVFLHYGQALFEGMKAFVQPDGSISLFRPDFNIRRMQEGAERLCLEPPPADMFLEGLEQLISVESRWSRRPTIARFISDRP